MLHEVQVVVDAEGDRKAARTDRPSRKKSRVSFIMNGRETRLFPKWADSPTARKSRVSSSIRFLSCTQV